MSAQLGVVLALLAAAIAMFAMNRPRMDAVALVMLTAAAVHQGDQHERSAGRLQRFEYRVDRGVVRHRRRFGAHGRGPAARRLAHRQGRGQRNQVARSADARRVRPRVDDEFHGRHRHLHSGGAPRRPNHRHGSRSIDDATEFLRSNQRHDDAGRDRAQSGRQQRTGPQRPSSPAFSSSASRRSACRSWSWASFT